MGRYMEATGVIPEARLRTQVLPQIASCGQVFPERLQPDFYAPEVIAEGIAYLQPGQGHAPYLSSRVGVEPESELILPVDIQERAAFGLDLQVVGGVLSFSNGGAAQTVTDPLESM